jgi:hypothetical protein
MIVFSVKIIQILILYRRKCNDGLFFVFVFSCLYLLLRDLRRRGAALIGVFEGFLGVSMAAIGGHISVYFVGMAEVFREYLCP